MSELSVIDSTGDTRLQWNEGDMTQVEAARRRFNELRGRGYAAWKVDSRGEKSESVNAFDPTAERLIMSPPLVGG